MFITAWIVSGSGTPSSSLSLLASSSTNISSIYSVSSLQIIEIFTSSNSFSFSKSVRGSRLGIISYLLFEDTTLFSPEADDNGVDLLLYHSGGWLGSPGNRLLFIGLSELNFKLDKSTLLFNSSIFFCNLTIILMRIASLSLLLISKVLI